MADKIPVLPGKPFLSIDDKIDISDKKSEIDPSFTKNIHISGTYKGADRIIVDVLNITDNRKIWSEECKMQGDEKNGTWYYDKPAEAGKEYKFAVRASIYEAWAEVEAKAEGNTKKQGYDIDKAVNAINENAESSSTGYCAKYVKFALEAGGLSGFWGNAKDYIEQLSQKGFTTIASTNYVPQKGDIVVIKDFQGKVKNHPYGHIQMYNGSKWVSDFVQNRPFWPGQDYEDCKPDYVIFRWE